MKKLLLVLTLTLLASTILCGCSTGLNTPGTAETRSQKMLKHRHINYWNWRMFNDDVEMFWLMDRNLRGSRYPVKVGH